MDELPLWSLFFCGMFGGLNCWTWSYPQDVIKTQLQVGLDYPVRKSWDGGVREVTRHIYRTQGWRGFWVGYSACVLRGTFPNGFGFVAYELAMSHLTTHYSGEARY